MEFFGSVNDPLLRSGNRKMWRDATERTPDAEDDVHTGDMSKRTIILGGLPAVLFTIMIAVTTFCYNDSPYGVIATFLLTLAKAVVAARLFNGRRWISWLGPLLGIASCAGVVAGLSVYSSQLALYYRYRDSALHVNVAPTEDATRFMGTGMLAFKAGTRVDVDRSVGPLRFFHLLLTMCCQGLHVGQSRRKNVRCSRHRRFHGSG